MSERSGFGDRALTILLVTAASVGLLYLFLRWLIAQLYLVPLWVWVVLGGVAGLFALFALLRGVLSLTHHASNTFRVAASGYAEIQEAKAKVKQSDAQIRAVEVKKYEVDQTDMAHQREMLQKERESQRAYELSMVKLRIESTRISFDTQVYIQSDGSLVQLPATQIQMLQALKGNNKALAQVQEADLSSLFPTPRDFAEVLQEFRPSMQSIYLADALDRPITSSVKHLCHVGLGGPTGGGKTNSTRLITGQLLSAGAIVYLCSPNFSQVKLNENRLEDWRPIVSRLAAPPARETKDIARMLESFHTLFENRKRAEERSPRRQKDVFLVLGEWPGITARIPDAAEILELLLRESRQYGIHLITEMQDALVKTIGLSSGARENLRTGEYFGGDPITAKTLLKLDNGETISETGLGKMGAVYVRTYAEKHRTGRIPFFSNRSLYMLLGAPPDPMPDHEVGEDEVPANYYRWEEGRYIKDGVVADPVPTSGDQGRTEGERDETGSRTRFFVPTTDPDLMASGPSTGELKRAINPVLERTGDSPTTRPHYPLMSATQETQFIALYPLHGLEKSLDQIKGCSHRHREHAREIVKRENLQRVRRTN